MWTNMDQSQNHKFRLPHNCWSASVQIWLNASHREHCRSTSVTLNATALHCIHCNAMHWYTSSWGPNTNAPESEPHFLSALFPVLLGNKRVDRRSGFTLLVLLPTSTGNGVCYNWFFDASKESWMNWLGTILLNAVKWNWLEYSVTGNSCASCANW